MGVSYGMTQAPYQSFHEVQRAPRVVRIILLLVITVQVVVAGVVMWAMYSSSAEANSSDAVVTTVTILVMSLVSWWLMAWRMIVVVSDNTIEARFMGTPIKRVIARADVVRATVRPLRAVGEFGGWGYRYGFGGKWGFIWDGAFCMDLELAKQKRLVISIVDAEGARKALGLPSDVGS
jgi:hypothetical protein